MWALGITPESSRRTIGALNHRAVSLALSGSNLIKTGKLDSRMLPTVELVASGDWALMCVRPWNVPRILKRRVEMLAHTWEYTKSCSVNSRPVL